MGDEPEVVNRVPEETPKPAIEKPSELVMRLLRFLCFREILGKWEALENITVHFGQRKFKIEQSLRPSKIQIYFIGKDGKLGRPFNARDSFMHFEAKDSNGFTKLAAELLKKNKTMVMPIKYKKGDYKKTLRIMAALNEPEKKWLTNRLTPIEQMRFLQQHELWNVEKGDEQ